jgi:hypothetical protein
VRLDEQTYCEEVLHPAHASTAGSVRPTMVTSTSAVMQAQGAFAPCTRWCGGSARGATSHTASRAFRSSRTEAALVWSDLDETEREPGWARRGRCDLRFSRCCCRPDRHVRGLAVYVERRRDLASRNGARVDADGWTPRRRYGGDADRFAGRPGTCENGGSPLKRKPPLEIPPPDVAHVLLHQSRQTSEQASENPAKAVT